MDQLVEHYRILGELGTGGMGVVYRAEDLKLQRMVALKFLAPALAGDPVVYDRFLREARAAAALNHPNICTIFEINDRGERPFIAMELLEGEPLHRRLERGPLAIATAVDLGVQIVEGLRAAHAKGIVHRDVKPANIFVTSDGRAKVVDFGLAKPLQVAGQIGQSAIETRQDEGLAVTRAGTTLGTVAYMSPEQARGERVDARSDLFSLGLVLYEMVTGRRAFDGPATAIVFDGILNRMPAAPSSLNPQVPFELERIIGCAIDKDPDARYQDAASLCADLKRVRRASDPDVPAATASHALRPAPSISAWPSSPAAGVPAASRSVGSGSAATAAPWWRRRRTAIAGLLLFAAIAAGAVAWRMTRVAAVGEGAPLLVADFTNRTGDPDFDGTLKQALTIKLEESPYLRVTSQQKVRELLGLMARSPDDAVTPEVGRQMCQRVGSGALMTGDIARLGSTYVVTLGAESCTNGDEIAREQVEVGRKDDVLAALGEASTAVRHRLGESLASVAKLDKPMVEATTSSLPALKAFAIGDQKRATGTDLDALPYYRQAIELDPQFAVAYGRLGTICRNIGEMDQARQYYAKAYELRDRASERERFYITAHYYTSVIGDDRRARDVYNLWHHTYPHDYVPIHNLGTIYSDLDGDYERALAAFREASAIEPRNRLPRSTILATLMALGRYDEARREAEKSIRELGDTPEPHLVLYQLDYLSGNRAGMEEQRRALERTPLDLDREITDYQIALVEGRFRQALELGERLAARADREGRRELATSGLAGQVLARASVGFPASEIRRSAEQVMSRKPDNLSVLKLAVALALEGDVNRARALAAPVWPRIANRPIPTRTARPALEALLELKSGRPARAIEVLAPATQWEKLDGGALLSNIRGLAYLAEGDGRAAEGEFRKQVDRHIEPFDLGLSIVHVFIARARSMSGDAPGARQAYERFFEVWKNADPDIPLMREARAEYDRLK